MASLETQAMNTCMQSLDLDSLTIIDSADNKEKRKTRMRCFKCWQIGVPPTWLVVCGALLVQVCVNHGIKTTINQCDLNTSYVYFLLGWFWSVSCGGEEVCIGQEGRPPCLQFLQGHVLLPTALRLRIHS